MKAKAIRRRRASHAMTMSPWSEYVDLLKPAGELVERTIDPRSEQLRAEL